MDKWVRTQRTRGRQGKLSPEQIAILDKLGFLWDVKDELEQRNRTEWEAKYEALAAYQRTHGHCRVLFATKDDVSLAHWVSAQRRARRTGKLSAERVQRMDELGFLWNVQDELEQRNRTNWESKYEALAAYRRAHGHCLVPFATKDDISLAPWVSAQREARCAGKLSAEQVRRLDELGFAWELTPEAKWEAKYEALAAYQRAHGHCQVPLTVTDGFRLGRWVLNQRRARRTGNLITEQVRRLDALGFPWDVPGEVEQMEQLKWEAKYEALAAYRRTHKQCRVRSKNCSPLSKWVARQRVARRKGKLSAEQVRRLDELGFPWDVQRRRVRTKPAAWESMYESLAAYRQTHGHCEVAGTESLGLSRWIARQRAAKRKGNLTAGQVWRLNRLRFVWDRHEEKWEQMLAALVKYKKVHGNCNVPGTWPHNRKLAAWVNMQRNYGTKGTLPPHRRKRLETLGFRFGSPRTVRKSKETSPQSSRPTSGPVRAARGMVARTN